MLRRIYILLLLILYIQCSDDSPTEKVDQIVHQKKIEFHTKLPYISKSALSCSHRIFYVINSLDGIDSLEYIYPEARRFMKTVFGDFDFNDSTLIGISMERIYSSSTKVYIDSLIQIQEDTIKVYWDINYESIYQDVTSPSDIVSVKKTDLPFVLIDGKTFLSYTY